MRVLRLAFLPRLTSGRRWVSVLAVSSAALIGGLLWLDHEGSSAGFPDDMDGGLTAPVHLCVAAIDRPCRTFAEVQARLADSGLEIVRASPVPGGTQGAWVLSLESSDPEVRFNAKWRPLSSQTILNDPAKEVGAYHVQRLLLGEDEYVIPPVVGHCFAVDHYEDALGIEEPRTFPATDCVFGFLSYWVTDSVDLFGARELGLVPVPSGIDGERARDPLLYDPARFQSNAAYQRTIANLNLTVHVVNNGDAHAGQFIAYPQGEHWFIVDNSISFESIPNPTLMFIQDLSSIHVPAIPASTAARVRDLARPDIEALRVLEEYVVVEGRLSPVDPGEPIGDADERLRWEGDRMQLGLTAAEIRGVWERVERLQRTLARAEIETF
jgi:hypothetical protein